MFNYLLDTILTDKEKGDCMRVIYEELGDEFRSMRKAYEIEDGDRETIKEQILHNFNGESYKKNVYVTLTDDVFGDEVDFLVNISEYLTYQEWVKAYNE
jgi:hypothetical protein